MDSLESTQGAHSNDAVVNELRQIHAQLQSMEEQLLHRPSVQRIAAGVVLGFFLWGLLMFVLWFVFAIVMGVGLAAL